MAWKFDWPKGAGGWQQQPDFAQPMVDRLQPRPTGRWIFAHGVLPLHKRSFWRIDEGSRRRKSIRKSWSIAEFHRSPPDLSAQGRIGDSRRQPRASRPIHRRLPDLRLGAYRTTTKGRQTMVGANDRRRARPG